MRATRWLSWFSALLLLVNSLPSANAITPSCIAYDWTNIGHVAPWVKLTAISGGTISGSWNGCDAAFTSKIRLVDITSNIKGPWIESPCDQSAQTWISGGVAANDQLVIEMCTDYYNPGGCSDDWDANCNGSGGQFWASNPAYSCDATNHAYTIGLNPSAYVGMEDEISIVADFDYNDSQLEVDGVATAYQPNQQVGTPIISETSSNEIAMLDFTAAAGIVVCYTTDGMTDPATDGNGHCTVGSTYAGPFPVDPGTLVEAIAGAPNYVSDSCIASFTGHIPPRPKSTSASRKLTR